MRLRQEGGEIAPATWLGGAVTAVTLGGVVLLAERWIGTTPAMIVFWLGCAVAALCLFGAGKQHYINVGRATAATPATVNASTSATALRRARIEYIDCMIGQQLTAFRDGFARRTPHHGGTIRDIQLGVLATFRSKDVPALVSASLAFTNERTGTVTKVHPAHWLSEEVNKVAFMRNDTKHVVVAASNTWGRRNVVPQDERTFAGSQAIVLHDLVDGDYSVGLTLTIDDDHDELQELVLNFSLHLDATNPSEARLLRRGG